MTTLATMEDWISARPSRRRTTKPARIRVKNPGGLAVLILATLCSVGSYAYYAHRGITFGYHDTYAHLEISRRFLVGPTPGITQLGGIWLPLPHLLQSLFAWNSGLYLSGLAGAIPSMAAFVLCAVFVFRIVRLFDHRQWPGVAAAVVFMSNPNMLYHQSTAMDELIFYACTLGAVHGLVRWAEIGDTPKLFAASLWSTAAMLCRYEAWFLSGLYVIIVVVMARRLGASWRDVRGLALVISVFGSGTAAAGWLLYNYMIFGSPLNFLTGAASSADQMARRHTDLQIGSLELSWESYATSMRADVGYLMLGVGVAGLVVLLVRDRLRPRSLPVLTLVALIPFWVYNISTGKAPIGLPLINGYLLNQRFGLVVLLPVALLAGCLVAAAPGRWGIVSAVGVMAGAVAVSAVAFTSGSVVLAVEGGSIGVSREFQRQRAVADYLQHQTSGRVLANLVGNERALFPVIDRLVYEGSRRKHQDVWAEALKDPAAAGVKVIVMRAEGVEERGAVDRATDVVYSALANSPALGAYRRTFESGEFSVWTRLPG